MNPTRYLFVAVVLLSLSTRTCRHGSDLENAAASEAEAAEASPAKNERLAALSSLAETTGLKALVLLEAPASGGDQSRGGFALVYFDVPATGDPSKIPLSHLALYRWDEEDKTYSLVQKIDGWFSIPNNMSVEQSEGRPLRVHFVYDTAREVYELEGDGLREVFKCHSTTYCSHIVTPNADAYIDIRGIAASGPYCTLSVYKKGGYKQVFASEGNASADPAMPCVRKLLILASE